MTKPASQKQIDFLNKLGYTGDLTNITSTDASAQIDRLYGGTKPGKTGATKSYSKKPDSIVNWPSMIEGAEDIEITPPIGADVYNNYLSYAVQDCKKRLPDTPTNSKEFVIAVMAEVRDLIMIRHIQILTKSYSEQSSD